jgi:hypothetical protein
LENTKARTPLQAAPEQPDGRKAKAVVSFRIAAFTVQFGTSMHVSFAPQSLSTVQSVVGSLLHTLFATTRTFELS